MNQQMYIYKIDIINELNYIIIFRNCVRIFCLNISFVVIKYMINAIKTIYNMYVLIIMIKN